MVGIENLFLHHAFTYCGHLGTTFGVYNRSYDVATECRTDLIEKFLVFLAGFGILVRADFKLCAVGGESAVQA